ncbi:conserved unknown protein [Ectocarpus siliculosus]|uniref:Uncharacterized protein n=1 Tax=Ectocarpus siliculosus TaxID=2880 RepID=D8LCN9_ECTSI|nr:conserved unknown protein [Ectocarpus siliculosus]|eukprot:CBN79552.1 conserved unknown protein [Ectocarpus siliculosus]
MSSEPDTKIIDLIQASAKEALTEGGAGFQSLEFFPPRTDTGVMNLMDRLGRMKATKPLFVDFTWGAGGSTADLTLDLTTRTKKEHGLVPNMHLTCTNMPVDKIDHALAQCKEHGIRNIVALRGDPPTGSDTWEAAEGGFTCALDLVKYIRKNHGDYFGISVAGYPEGHPNRIKEVPGGVESLSEAEKGRCKISQDAEGKEVVTVCSDADFEIEMNYIKEKVDAGADFIITQMFFDPAVYASYIKACRDRGIEVPVVPGLMCINAYGGFKKMTGFCLTRVPPELMAKMEEMKEDEKAVKAFGVDYGEKMCNALLAAGAPGLHFYTLNLEKVTVGILDRLNLLADYKMAEREEDTAQMIGMIKSSKKSPEESGPENGAGVTPAAPSSLVQTRDEERVLTPA